MALIICPECGHDTSDTLEMCPHCGFVLKNKAQNKRKGALIVLLVTLVLIIAVAFKVYNWIKVQEWTDNCYEAYNEIINTAVDIERIGNQINSVWNNSIWMVEDPDTDVYTMSNGVFYDDFNDALEKLYNDWSFIDDCTRIEVSKNEIDALMNELRDPPSSKQEEYDAICELYNAYYDLYDAVINTNGKSLLEFHDDFGETDKRLAKEWGKIERFFY